MLQASADVAAEPTVTLDLALDPADAARLVRLPEIVRRRGGRLRVMQVRLVWHDTPDAALAADGCALCERQVGRETVWRLERLRGDGETPWLPGQPPPLLAEAAERDGLGRDAPGRAIPRTLLPIAACEGQLRTLRLDGDHAPLTITLLEATLRAVAGERPVCRVVLTGAPAAVAPLVLALSGPLTLRVPDRALAAEAYGVAGRDVAPQALGPPVLPTDVGVGEAFAKVAGHLAGVMLHWAPLAGSGATPEPVHQMRVALRRLRSAIKLFARAVACPDLDAVTADLQLLGGVLGPARDWDVFCAGTGRAVGRAFDGDRAVARVLAAAEKQRQAAYAALRETLAGPAFRRAGLRLACLTAVRPWQAAPSNAADEVAAKQAATLAEPLADFATHVLSRRLAHVLEPGDDLSALPLEALHALRIQGKRLRYAAEFFAPLFPPRDTSRFLRRISALQERLGHLNDGAVAEALMAQLAGTGAERSHATGIVRGFVAAGMRGGRNDVAAAWRKFRRLEPFWA